MSDESGEAAVKVKPRIVGRYALFDEIAAGGMATVHFGRLVGAVGFARTVAIKRLHPQFAKDPEFVSMFLDEARLASRIQHPNVVTTLDIVDMEEELFLVMEYVAGESLSRLIKNSARQGERIPPNIVISMMSGMLHGLHAAHEATSEQREKLNIVHRDVSPQNVLVGTDGVSRVLDFGVAKAAMRSQSTRDGQMKGKLSYMSPEQLNGKDVDRRTDIFAAAIVLWEALTSKRLFSGSDAGEILGKVLATEIPGPKTIVPEISDELNAVVMKGLERDINARFQTAREFAIAIEQAGSMASTHKVGEWVEAHAGEGLAKKSRRIAEIESMSGDLHALYDREEESGLSQRLSAPGPTDTRVEGRASTSGEPSTASQASSISVATQPNQGNKKSAVFMALGFAALVGAAGVILFRGDPAPPPAAAPPAPTVEAKSAPEPVPAETAEAPQVEEELVFEEVDAGALAAPPTPAAAAPAPSPKRTPRKPAAPRPKPAPAPAPASAPAKSCNPPFMIDKSGIKRLKPWCL